MSNQKAEFAKLLTEAVYAIKESEQVKVSIVQDELGYALKKEGGASIEHWRKQKGSLPKLQDLIELAHQIQRRTDFKRAWMGRFLKAGGHPVPEALLNEMYSPLKTKETGRFDALIARQPAHQPEEHQGSRLIHSRNRNFIGRQRDLEVLVAKLIEPLEHDHPPAVVVSGLGGLGKTQLASQFTYQYAHHFPGGIYWIRFEEPSAIRAELIECGGYMGLSSTFWAKSEEERLQLVMNAWQQPIVRLLIFDNCEDVALFKRWVPKIGGCRILVTSRIGEWDPTLGVEHYPLTHFFRHQSIDLLRTLSGLDEREDEVLDQIANEVGDLPLALHMAGTHLRQLKRTTTSAAYLAELQHKNILNHPSLRRGSHSPTDHELHIFKTFALSYDRLNPSDMIDKIARDLLVRAAHFAPGEPIWYDLLVQTLTHLPQKENESGTAAYWATLAFTRLLELGLVEADPREIKQLRMHRLIGAFVRQIMPTEVAQAQADVEEVVLAATKAANRAGTPRPLLAWGAQLRAVVEDANMRQEPRSAHLYHAFGDHLVQNGEYHDAITFFERSIAMWKRLGQDRSQEMAAVYHSLGGLHRELREFPTAKHYLDQALALRYKQANKVSLVVAESENGLGRWYFEKGDHEKAEQKFRLALDLVRQLLGEKHLLTAEYLNNLGLALSSQRNLDEALPLIQQALEIRLERLGRIDKLTALSYNNVGYVLSQKQDNSLFEAVIFNFENACLIWKEILGEKHPNVGNVHLNLGIEYRRNSRWKESLPHLEHALDIFAKTYQPNNKQIADAHAHLGATKLALSLKGPALKHFRAALQIYEEKPAESRAAIEYIQGVLSKMGNL